MDRLLRHPQDSARTQHVEIGAIHSQDHHRPGDIGPVIGRIGAEMGALRQFIGAAEIGDQLAGHDAVGLAAEDAGIAQPLGSGEARVPAVGVDGVRFPIDLGEEGRPRLPDLLPDGVGGQLGGGDLRVIGQRIILRLLQREMEAVLTPHLEVHAGPRFDFGR